MVNGLCTEAAYPYRAANGACAAANCAASAHTRLAGFTDIPARSETGLILSLAAQPVSVAITATIQFQLYTGGIITQMTSAAVNHAVLLYGYRVVSGGQSYLLLKNSWGTSWGEAGYMRFAFGGTPCASCSGVLNVNTKASFPLPGAV